MAPSENAGSRGYGPPYGDGRNDRLLQLEHGRNFIRSTLPTDPTVEGLVRRLAGRPSPSTRPCPHLEDIGKVGYRGADGSSSFATIRGDQTGKTVLDVAEAAGHPPDLLPGHRHSSATRGENPNADTDVVIRSSKRERAYDIYSRLLKSRIVFLGTAIEDTHGESA